MRLLKTTLVAGTLLALLFVQLALSTRHQSQTIDEGFHLVAGYRYWQCHDFGMNSEHPPLVKFVAAAPAWFGHLPVPDGDCGREPTDKGYGYGLGVNYLYGGDVDAAKVLVQARLAVSIFSLLLAVGCFLFARSMFGDLAAFLALSVLVFEPNILAHGALVTTDAAVSAFMLLTAFCFFRYQQGSRSIWLLCSGLSMGSCLSSKHSGVLLVPSLILIAAGELFLKNSSSAELKSTSVGLRSASLRTALGLFVTFAIAFAVLWSTYGLRFAARPDGRAMDPSVAEFVQDVQEEGTHGVVLTQVIPRLAHWHLLPEAYLHGMVDVLNASDPGKPAYLLGRLYPHGRWFYFPVAFVIKSTVAFLLLLALASIAYRWRESEHRRSLLYLIVPPAVVLLVAMQSGLDIGYRHVLPVIGFLCVLVGGAAASLIARGGIWRGFVIALLVAHTASSLRAYPNYLPYSNELWGGPSRTYRYLTDSNVDWGQGLYQVRDYLQRHGIRDCWMAYDGAALPSYFGIPCRMLTANASNPNEVPPLSATGVFVISALSTSGIEWEPGPLNPYLSFQQSRPVEVSGGAMLVYRGTFDRTGVAAVAHIARSDDELETRPKDALRDAQAAVQLTPESVRAHLALGQALAALGRKVEAQTELERVLQLARAAGNEWYPEQIADAKRELWNLDQR